MPLSKRQVDSEELARRATSRSLAIVVVAAISAHIGFVRPDGEVAAMLKKPMIEKPAMRLLGMIEALKAQEQDPAARELRFLERFGQLVNQQWNGRENQALGRRLKNANLRTTNACVEEIDYRTARGLDMSVIRSPSRR